VDESWRIELFGGLRARCGERVVERFRTRKTAALLGYLALDTGRAHAREVLLELLWPEAPRRSAGVSLSTALWALRSELEGPGRAGTVLLADRHTIGLNPRTVRSDVGDFEAALAKAQRSDAAVERLGLLTVAVEQYQGELMAGFAEDWLMAEQRRLADRFHAALQELTTGLEETGRVAEAIDHAWRGVRLDPLREETRRELMRLQIVAGHPELAVEQYARLKRLLRDQLGAEPMAETKVLIARLRAKPSVPSTGADARSLMPSTVPAPLTRFFGRDDERRSLRRLLAGGDARLVTLTGPPGIGKTRLAQEVARGLGRTYSGAVWFVPLAELTEPSRLPETVLRAVQPGGESSGDARSRLLAALSFQRSLLVLDNMEHLLPAGGKVADELLQQVPELCCLVTSRRRLGVPGEREVPVEPLLLPGETDRETLTECPSIQLFVDRVQSVLPGFALTDSNAATVAELCSGLEGIPLSLELAAAWSGTLAPGEMLTALRDRFWLLTTGDSHRPLRHRSLRAAVEGTVALLPSRWQRLFAELSVFCGGWTAEAAGAVCRERKVIDGLAALRDVSIISTAPGDGPRRFQMLETLRRYAEGLLAPEDRAAVGTRHASYYLRLAEEGESALYGSEPGDWMDRLAADHANLQAAFAQSLGDLPETALRIAIALTPYWDRGGYWSEGLETLERALAAETEGRSIVNARAWVCAGWHAYLLGDYEKAKSHLQAGLAVERELSAWSDVVTALHNLAQVAWAQDSLDEARELHTEGLTTARRIGAERFAARELRGLGDVALALNQVPEARSLYAESLALVRELGREEEAATVLCALGSAEVAEGNLDSAERVYREGLAVAQAFQVRRLELMSNLGLGEVALRRGDSAAAREQFELCLATARELGGREHIGTALFGLGRAARSEGDLDEARQCLEESLCLRGTVGKGRALVPVLEELALATAGEQAVAVRHWAAAAAVREGLEPSRRPAEVADRDSRLAALRAALGEAAFEQAWGEGSAAETGTG